MEMMSGPPVMIDNYLQAAVAPYLSPRLIDEEGWRRVRFWAAQLPGAMTDFFGFEIKLAPANAQADFLVCSERDPIAKIASFRERAEAPAFWRRLHPFVSRWTDPASRLYTKVHNLWLEFDTAVSEKIELPGVFFGANDLFSNAAENPGWLREEAIPLLSGKSLGEKERQCIERCLSALPKDAFLFQIGRMLSRPEDTTRICARGLTAESIPAYLAAVRWPGSMAQLGDLLNWLAASSARIDVDMDAAAEVAPRLGLECYFNSALQQIEFTRSLNERNLASADKINAALSWAGAVHERINREAWPRDLRAISDLLEGRAASVFLRWLHHIKVVLSPGGLLEAKAYLAVSHNWLAPDQIRALIQSGNSQ